MMIRKRKTIGSLFSKAKQLLPILAVAVIGTTSAYAQFTPEAVVVESRTGGKNFAAYAEIDNVYPNSWSSSSVKSTVTGVTPGIGSRFNSTAGLGGKFQVTPTLPNAGGQYLVYVTTTSGSGTLAVTADVTVTGGTGLPASTTAFSAPHNTWNLVGTLDLDDAVTTPTVLFTETANDNRFYADAVMFVPYEPCAGTAAVTVPNDAPIQAGQTEVKVTGVDASATAINVYQNGILIGTRDSGIVANTNIVTTTALTSQGIISATQVVGGQEGCVPGDGPIVGPGANPRVRVALTIRESNTLGPIGADGTGTGNLYFLGADNTALGGGAGAGSLTGAPNNGRDLSPSACWQTISFTNGSDLAFRWNPQPGATVASIPTAWGILDSLNFALLDGDNGPYEIYIDEFKNGETLIDGWESYEDGIASTFRSPGFSGTTGGNLMSGLDVSAVTSANADTGNKSLKLSWQFRGNESTRWVRVTTSGAGGKQNPVLDLSQPISFRILVLPVGQSAAEGQITAQPVGGQISPGANTTLSVTAAGTGNTYQWSKDGNPIGGATDSSYSINSANSSHNGDYTVEVSNATCSKVSTSTVATILVEHIQPLISDVSGAGTSNVTITWSAVDGVTYRLQYKDDLNDATWTDLAPVVASGTSASTTDTSATSQARFYRVQVQ